MGENESRILWSILILQAL